MTAVIWLSVTVASVVATCVIRFGNAGAAQSPSCPRRPVPPSRAAGQPHRGSSSQVSVTCSLYPSQNSSRLTPHRASVSYGEAIRAWRSEEHTSELQSHVNLVCRLLLEKKK